MIMRKRQLKKLNNHKRMKHKSVRILFLHFQWSKCSISPSYLCPVFTLSHGCSMVDS